MKYNNGKKVVKGALLALLAVTLTAGPSLAATYDLCASDGTVTMPDGTIVPIWGYADITASGSCTTGLATLPGPVLTDVVGETLTINLTNALSVPVSIFIPGMAKLLSPQLVADGQGRERLTSFDVTVASGASGSYSWTAKEGTHLYQSGTDIRTQIPMGLYGALVVSGPTYPVVAQEEVLLFSEIDPALNADPAGFGGARVSSWSPQYFLINGQSYAPANLPININVSEDVLLRFVNAGLQTFAPTFGGGLYMDVIAEDGNLSPYPLTQYGIELTAGKTFDAIVNVGSPGTYPLYDRAGHLTNGGLVVNISAGAVAGAPEAVNDAYSVAEDGVLTATAGDGTFPGVLDNDTDAAQAVLMSGASNGVLGLAADGSFSYSPYADFNGSDSFTYAANDGAGGPNSVAATVTITVTPVNDAPVAVADGYDAVAGTTLSVAAPGVLANDSDVDGDPLTAVASGTPPAGLTLNTDGSFAYTPAGAVGSTETFDYVANDGSIASNVVTVTITVTGAVANEPPVANDDTASTPRNTPLVDYDIVANDTDADGTIDPASVVITTGGTTQRGGTVVNNGNGTITYSPPNPGFRGTDTLQYTVDDDDGATSNVATVRINVTR
ncbi:Ig-like domain-containing protein [Desulfocastanea catecholica]